MIDVAFALEYLHHVYVTVVVHSDLKPSNVLLDERLVGHVSDFGLTKLFGEGESITHTKILATMGYIAPAPEDIIDATLMETRRDWFSEKVKVAPKRKYTKRNSATSQRAAADVAQEETVQTQTAATGPIAPTTPMATFSNASYVAVRGAIQLLTRIEFTGTKAEEDPQNYRDGMQKVFLIMHATEIEAAEFGAFQLQDVAHIWYESWEQSQGEYAPPATRDEFVDAFSCLLHAN
ncbi:probable LRR receptor-like serine/threonine-protein kinase At1g74360 [Lycium ferocissimum]|uniref:probable LRR receptor-like serine/threonine-protein kinase At1g74360 n=1 Tax=Lycium ferocissimum TaxID=112874 RepID=UPI002814AC37|nr:probable LRR receptor-like serine/threonine-protein kinase At1g74360 [Lycium ferocissimum]